MTVTKRDKRTMRLVAFLLIGLPLAYIFVAGFQGLSLLALLGLSILYVALRPFKVTIKAATILLVLYLIISGLLSFSQPLFSQSWPVFAVVMLVSALMQPVIFVLALDAVVDIFRRKHRMYDMAVVVLLWLSTLAVSFGSIALFKGGNDEVSGMLFLFVAPWLVNGIVFIAACLLLAFTSGRMSQLHQPKKRRSKQ